MMSFADRSPLAGRCKGWDALISELAQPQECRFLSSVPRRIAAAVLAAPTAIALWIAARAPQLASREHLRVLVIGAETVDAVDEGRWYAWLPRLLGRNFVVETTLLGDQLDAGFSSDATHLAPERRARQVQGTLGEFLRNEDVGNYDLAVIFHPGMQKNRAWLEDGSLARIVASGTPLLASAYEEVECQMDQWVIECHGFAATGEPLLNPFFLDLSDERTRIQWARALWQFAPRAPEPGRAPDRERLAALDLLTRMVMHSMLMGGAPSFEPGARIELQSSAGAKLYLIHIFDGYCANPATCKLLRFTPDGQLADAGVLTAEDIAAYPALGARDIERAMWAARIKARRILGPLVSDATGETAAVAAANMFAALRERARAQFRT